MDFRLPELGEGICEAELTAWLVQPGAAVKHGQSLMEVLTDKAAMEVPAPFAGTITALQAQPGQVLKVGSVVLAYTPADQATPASTSTGPAESACTRTEPAEPASPAPVTALSSGAAQTTTLPFGNGSAAGSPGLPIKAAPSVRQMARKLGIDLASVPGSGPGGRILIDDLTRVTGGEGGERRVGGGGRKEPLHPPPPTLVPGTRIRLQGLRRKVADHMVRAKQTIPHYSYVDECDVTELVRLREALKEPFARLGVRITYLPFFVKAVTTALKEVPIVNASLDETQGEIILHDRYHIGIAVAAPGGLMVPVIHDADRKDLTQIAGEIERLSTDARAGKSRRDDLRGGTFTITSIGNVGGLIATPIVNHPEVGILGIGKIVKRPVYDPSGNIRPAEMVYLSFSFDHRVLDGAIGAAFGNAVIRQLQNPAAMLLTGGG